MRPISSFASQDLVAPIGQCIVASESGGGRHRRFPSTISTGIGAHTHDLHTDITHTQEWAPRHTQPSFLDPYTHISSQRLADVPHGTVQATPRRPDRFNTHAGISPKTHTYTSRQDTSIHSRSRYSSQIYLRHTHQPSIGFRFHR